MLKKALIVVAVLVVALLVVIAIQPSEYRVERSANMKAAPDAVYAQVADFHHWNAWSPWAALDPAAKNTFEGPASGKGAIFAWDGNDQVGAGRMTVTDATPPSHLAIRLEFFRPMEGDATTEFRFAPGKDGSTDVTWSMSGTNGFLGKAFSLVMDFDAMIGKDYDTGLANLRSVVEPKPAK